MAPTQVCKYQGNCTNKNCTYLHINKKHETNPKIKPTSTVTTSQSTFVTPLNSSDGEKPKFKAVSTTTTTTTTTTTMVPIDSDVSKFEKPSESPSKTDPSIKKNIECPHWIANACKNGDKCEKKHTPRVAKLDELLEYISTKKSKPDEISGVFYEKPLGYPGLPDLVPNGKCIITKNDLVIYFIPFFRPINGKVYFKKLILFRFNKTKNLYVAVYHYSKTDFHIVSASASNGYFLVARLPYDKDVLKLIEEAKRTRTQLEKQRQENSNLKLIIKQLRKENENLELERLEEKQRNEKIQQETLARLQRAEDNINNMFRSRDPVDLFIYNNTLKSYIYVLEYHKPADHVLLEGKTMELYDKDKDEIHTFKILLTGENVTKYNFEEPLQPKQLCIRY